MKSGKVWCVTTSTGFGYAAVWQKDCITKSAENPKQARFLNVDRLNDFRGSGGVRLEENVCVTEDGCENLTTCPRAVSEVLDVMSGKPWPPEKDVLPELRRNWVRNENGNLIRFELPSGN